MLSLRLVFNQATGWRSLHPTGKSLQKDVRAVAHPCQPDDRWSELCSTISHLSYLCSDAYHAVLAARAVITPLNTRLTPAEVDYILGHSEAKIILVDYEYTHLVPAGFSQKYGPNSVIVSHDTGREGCPYEAFLRSGRVASQEQSWAGLPVETDEDAAATLCYT
jgi:long-subunit acyl-CoA synthetase (AMP-forming)